MRTSLLTAVCATALLNAPISGQVVDPRIEAILHDVSAEHLHEYLTMLTSFETRNSLSFSNRPNFGVLPARQYIRETMQRFSDRLQVEFDCYEVEPQGRIPKQAELCNVVATLPGRSERRILVSGHYDTVARIEASDRASGGGGGGFDWSRYDNPAPGANDHGSGTVLTMEAARVLAQSGIEFDAPLVFVAFVAEEEGLVGASLMAAKAGREGWVIDAMSNNDIIGSSLGGNGILDSHTLRVFSEEPIGSPSRQVATYMLGHEVRFSESRKNYSRQHTAQDTLGGVDFEYLARNTRVNTAGVATMANAPPAPDVNGPSGPMLGRGESGYHAKMRWHRSPGATRYRVVWREAWTPDWQHEVIVSDIDRFVLENISIDDYVFGIAAIGSDGHESLISAYVRPPRARSDIGEVGQRR